jgi:uncharacterized protein (DUF2237 family)
MLRLKPLAHLIAIFCWLTASAYGAEEAKNVLGKPLARCCTHPMSGVYRDGYCRTGADDSGTHVIAAVMTKEFLLFTQTRGNDLITPDPAHDFPGLKPGDHWCLCALRWREAEEAGVAPPLNLNATNQKALRYIPLKKLQEHGRRGW